MEHEETRRVVKKGIVTVVATIVILVLISKELGIGMYNTIVGTTSLIMGEISIILTIVIYKNQEEELIYRERPIISLTKGRWYMFYRDKEELKEGIFKKDNTLGKVEDMEGDIENRGVRNVEEVELKYNIEVLEDGLEEMEEEINRIIKPLEINIKRYGDGECKLTIRKEDRDKYGVIISSKELGEIGLNYKEEFVYNKEIKEGLSIDLAKEVPIPRETNVVWMLRGIYDSIVNYGDSRIKENELIIESMLEEINEAEETKKIKGENYFGTVRGFKSLGFDEMYQDESTRMLISETYFDEKVKEVVGREQELEILKRMFKGMEGNYVKNKNKIIGIVDRVIRVNMEMVYTDKDGRTMRDVYVVTGVGKVLGDLVNGLMYDINFNKIKEYQKIKTGGDIEDEST